MISVHLPSLTLFMTLISQGGTPLSGSAPSRPRCKGQHAVWKREQHPPDAGLLEGSQRRGQPAAQARLQHRAPEQGRLHPPHAGCQVSPLAGVACGMWWPMQTGMWADLTNSGAGQF